MTALSLAAVVLLAPLAAVVLCVAARGPRVAERINLAASAVTLAAALPLPFVAAGHSAVGLGAYLLVDALGAWVVLCAALVYLLASIYAVGYMRLLEEDERLPRFYALFAGFAFTTLQRLHSTDFTLNIDHN